MVEKKIYQYGYNPDDLDRFMWIPQKSEAEWGYSTEIINGENYRLSQIFIKQGSICPLMPQDKEAVVYLEMGLVTIQQFELRPQETLLLSVQTPIQISAQENSFLYIFASNSLLKGNSTLQKSRTFDIRQKDWAENQIETIVNKDYCGKKIFFKKDNKSSLHFHCQKDEVYFIHSGRALLRFRAGQGEDRFFTLEAGQATRIPPGLIHQAGALEDLIIIEVSTHSEDKDSFIVESEFAPMPNFK